MTDVTVGFTGTQDELTMFQKHNIVAQLRLKISQANKTTAIHGDCIGADRFFAIVAYQLGCRVVSRPGCDREGRTPKRAFTFAHEEYHPEEYMSRNTKIVLDSDFMICAPKEMHEELRSGTWSTIRRARKIGVPYEIIYPV